MGRKFFSMRFLAGRILLFAFVLAATSATVVAQQVIATIPVDTNPRFAAINPVTNKIYVFGVNGNNMLTVIDGTTLSTTTVGAYGPAFAAINPVTNRIYVSDAGDNVTVIDGMRDSIIGTVTVGNAPFFLAVNATTNQVYVANYISDSVSVIDGTTNSVSTTVSVGASPYFLAVNPVTNRIYVGNSDDGSVSIIDGANNSVMKTIAVGDRPIGIAVNLVTNNVYVANAESNNVTVIDGANNSVIKTVTVGAYPNYVAADSVTNQIYVLNRDSVTVIDGTSNFVVKTVTVGNSPSSLAVNPATNTIYVPNAYSYDVTVIDGTSLTTKTVTVGTEPDDAAVNPVTNRVYVMNYGDGTVSVIAGADATPLHLITVTPCRLVDTRSSSPIQGGTSTAFNIPQLGGCGIPSTAAAYSLNVTAVPQGPLGYLTAWPTGEDQPLVSTLNSLDGRVKANAAIVPAGYRGAISVYASNTTDVVLDINGYFTTASGSTLAFYPLTPCRVADTRNPKGQLGGPYLKGEEQRGFPIQASPCNIPSTALAYSMNFTAVPHGPLGYLTVWPWGKEQPVVSTLNALTGAVTANAAIVPAGYTGDILVYPSNDTDLVIDINGYFALAGTGGLSLYSSSPCRVLDTRQEAGSFSGGLGIDVVHSPCGPPETAQAYVLNATVVPQTSLGYLTLWPNGEEQPGVATLNALDGTVTSNMAIVPTVNGSIDAYASNLTQLVLDISGYFAP